MLGGVGGGLGLGLGFSLTYMILIDKISKNFPGKDINMTLSLSTFNCCVDGKCQTLNWESKCYTTNLMRLLLLFSVWVNSLDADFHFTLQSE